jgi:hypothetical protein
MKGEKVYQYLARNTQRIRDLLVAGRVEEAREAEMDLIQWMKNNAPSGSGIDSGTEINFDASGDTKVILTTEFHHMTEHGYYDGWTQHTLTISASLRFGFVLKVGGRDRNMIKEYLGDLYHEWLSQEVANG